MGFEIDVSDHALLVRLTGMDRLMNWRRSVSFGRRLITSVAVEPRGLLEKTIDHRVLGFGTHNGSKRPNRRRVGTMLGREVTGKQFWAVLASDERAPLLVVTLDDGDFRRAVLMVPDPARLAADLG